VDITDEMLWWDCSDQKVIDEVTKMAQDDWHWDITNPNGGNAELVGDPNTDLVTLIENHFDKQTDRILAKWSNTFWSLLDQYGAQGAFETILAHEDPTNKSILAVEDRTYELILAEEDPTNL